MGIKILWKKISKTWYGCLINQEIWTGWKNPDEFNKKFCCRFSWSDWERNWWKGRYCTIRTVLVFEWLSFSLHEITKNICLKHIKAQNLVHTLFFFPLTLVFTTMRKREYSSLHKKKSSKVSVKCVCNIVPLYENNPLYNGKFNLVK